LTSSSRRVRSLLRKDAGRSSPWSGMRGAQNRADFAVRPHRRAHVRFTWPPLICAVTVRTSHCFIEATPDQSRLIRREWRWKCPLITLVSTWSPISRCSTIFLAKVVPMIERFGGRYLTKAGSHEILEGDWKPNRVVIIEFPDIASIESWYRAPEYQPFIALRRSATTDVIFILEGI
jgi:uncharacterized protein (DUF1330 family)